MSAGFKTESELVRQGGRLIRSALEGLESSVRTKFEVPTPGGVPDLIVYTRQGDQIGYVVTVEFKLRDWRRALQQAFRNRNVCNEAYVVLDYARARSAVENLKEFHDANVGLIAVDRGRHYCIWHIPQPSLPFSPNFARVVAKQLVLPRRDPAPNLLFTRSLRGGVSLAPLRRSFA